jgi:hypothetical protein
MLSKLKESFQEAALNKFFIKIMTANDRGVTAGKSTYQRMRPGNFTVQRDKYVYTFLKSNKFLYMQVLLHLSNSDCFSG